jgi:predicted Zn-dependent peptidase
MLTPIQLHTVQKQLIGQLAIAWESNAGAMLALGKSFLLLNRYDPLERIIAAIREITANELQEIANDVLSEEKISMLTFRPV